MRIGEVDILILSGDGEPDPGHWLARWQARLSSARPVALHRPDEGGTADSAAERLVAAIETAPRPVVLVAHGSAVLTVAEAAGRLSGLGVAGAFLVAPVDTEAGAPNPPDAASFRPVPRDRLPFPSFLVASRNDPRCAFERAEAFGADWNALVLDAGQSGHIDPASGHGPWPEGLLIFARFMRQLRG